MNKQEVEAKAHEYATIAFGNPKTMFPSQIIQYNNGYEGFVRGAIWMQQNQSGMRWVRASERDIPSYKTIARFIHTKAILMNAQSFLTLMPDQKPLIEWLDESASSEVERLRKEHKEMYAKLQQVQALIEVKGYYDLLDPIQSLINKIEANGNCK